MKPRTPEAARLETDYLDRVRESLRNQASSEVDEVIQSLQEHIEEEVAEGQESEVSLVQMAGVLESLGSPEAFSQEEADYLSAAPARLAAEDRHQFAKLLDAIYVAYFVDVLGLFVPFVDLYFCGIIGGSLLASVLMSRPPEEEDLRKAGRLSLASALLLTLMFVVTTLSFSAPLASLFGLPVSVAQIICAVAAYWIILGKTASVVAADGHRKLAESIYATRIAYIISGVVLIACGFCLGLVAIVTFEIRNVLELWWIGFLFLPFQWVFGGLLILVPLSRARAALRS